MREKPDIPRVVAFFDGQNLFHSAKVAFGYTYPNFDPVKLANYVTQKEGGQLIETRFYTGIPDPVINPRWNTFWNNKLSKWGRIPSMTTVTRPLRYQAETITLNDGTTREVSFGREKGIDVRIAIDILKMARNNQYDIAVIFSQDQDLAEVALELRETSREKDRWIRVISAFPENRDRRYAKGINHTACCRISQADYSECLDP